MSQLANVVHSVRHVLLYVYMTHVMSLHEVMAQGPSAAGRDTTGQSPCNRPAKRGSEVLAWVKDRGKEALQYFCRPRPQLNPNTPTDLDHQP